MNCNHCDTEFTSRRVTHRFCKKECRDAHHNKKTTKKSTWNSLRFQIIARDGFCCVYCGKSPTDGARLEVDHVWPKKRGGESVPENMVSSCRQCNTAKQSNLLAGGIIEGVWEETNRKVQGNKSFRKAYSEWKNREKRPRSLI